MIVMEHDYGTVYEQFTFICPSLDKDEQQQICFR